MKPWCNASTWVSRPTGSTHQRSARRHPLRQPFLKRYRLQFRGGPTFRNRSNSLDKKNETMSLLQVSFTGLGGGSSLAPLWPPASSKSRVSSDRPHTLNHENALRIQYLAKKNNETRKGLQWILLDHFLLCRRCSSFGLHRCGLWRWRHGHLPGALSARTGWLRLGFQNWTPKSGDSPIKSHKINVSKDFPLDFVGVHIRDTCPVCALVSVKIYNYVFPSLAVV